METSDAALGVDPAQIVASITALLQQIQDDLGAKFTLREVIALVANVLALLVGFGLLNNMTEAIVLPIVVAAITVGWMIWQAIEKSKQAVVAAQLVAARVQALTMVALPVGSYRSLASQPLSMGTLGGVPPR